MTEASRRAGRGSAVTWAMAALLAATAAAAACGGDPDRPRRARGSAVWVDPERAPLTPEARRTLGVGGVEEVFLEAATLRWEAAEAHLEATPSAFQGGSPPGTPVTLVVRGEAPAPDTEPRAAARSLARGFRDLRYRAEGAGLLPVGLHLDLSGDLSRDLSGDPSQDLSREVGGDPGSDPALAAELLREVRRALGTDALLSTTIPADRVGDKAIRELAAAVDYVVAFLYGQAPGVPDEPTAWDPQRAADRVRALEALGRDYVVGLHVLGRAEHLGPAGDRRTSTTRATLAALAQDPTLRLSIDDPFAGVGRLVHTFQAQGASQAVGWRLAPGERVRVVRTAPALLRELVERMETDDLPHHAGFVFHRLAAPDEDLSLAPAELAAALGALSPEPDLRWRIVVQSRQRNSAVLQVELLNRSRQRTDLAATDGNYLEVRAEGGYFDRVDPGGFARYTLWRGDQEARPGTGWREPDRVRLYTRLVGSEERIGGALLTLRGRAAEPSLLVSGRFFLPDGSELELPHAGGPLADLMTGPDGEAEAGAQGE